MSGDRGMLRWVMALCAVLLVGCAPPEKEEAAPGGGAGTGAAETGATATKPQVGPVALVVKTLANPFFLTMQEGARRAAAEEGVDLRVQAPAREGDIARQTQFLMDDVSQGFKAILVAPADSKAVIPALKRANSANLPVINVDNRIDRGEAAAQGLKIERYVGADNEEGGRMAGEHLGKLLNGRGKVAMLEGIPGVDNAEARKRGFRAGIAKSPGVEVVDSRSAHWEADEASRVFANILQAHPDLKGLFCANDSMALGAIRALKNAGKKPGEIVVVGYDNIREAQAAMREGWLQGTIDQGADEMGYQSVKHAAQLLKGKKPPTTDLLVPLKLVTPETAKRNAAVSRLTPRG